MSYGAENNLILSGKAGKSRRQTIQPMGGEKARAHPGVCVLQTRDRHKFVTGLQSSNANRRGRQVPSLFIAEKKEKFGMVPTRSGSPAPGR